MDIQSVIERLSRQIMGSHFKNKVNLSLGDDGVIHIDGQTIPATVTVGEKQADATISVSLNDLSALANGTLDPMSAFMTGRLKVHGDMTVAMALQNALVD